MRIVEIKDHVGNGATKLALTRNEAAKVLSISAVTLDRLAARGLIHPSRATRRPLYPIPEMERLLRDTTVGVATASKVLGTKDRSEENGPGKRRKDASQSPGRRSAA